jgi:Protein of unknown function (DUF3363)
MESKLRALGTRGDIIKTMHRVMREAGIDRAAGSFAIYDSSKEGSKIVGRVTGVGLTDEISDRHYVVIDGMDGKVHYADLGSLHSEHLPEKGMIASLESRSPADNKQSQSRLRLLSYLNFEKLIEADGATWLDKELLNRTPDAISLQGFRSQVDTSKNLWPNRC